MDADPKNAPLESSRSATQEDIAQHLGISAMSVSRALRGAEGVSEKTRKLVQETALELGFRPNPLLQAHMASMRRKVSQSHANLAWITLPQPSKTKVRMKIVEEGARQRAHELGYRLDTITYIPGQMTDVQMKRMLKCRGIYGFIVAPLPDPRTIMDLPWDDFAVSTIGRSLQTPLISYIMHHDYDGMDKALNALLESGHQRIAMLHQLAWDSRTEHASTRVFEQYRRFHPGRLLEPQYYHGWQLQEFRQWLKAAKPDAVVGDFIEVAKHLSEAGANIPEETSFVTLSWRDTHAHLTGIRKQFDLLGSSTVDLVVAQLHRNERGIPKIRKSVWIEGEWMTGITICPRH